MKPRTNTQLEISRLAGYLPGLTKEHTEWAKLNCFPQDAIRRKTGDITCTLCGHQWNSKTQLADTLTGVECPHCKSELKVMDSKKRVIDEIGYMTISYTMGEYQILRHFLVMKKFSVGEKVEVSAHEVVQLWFDEDGKCIPVAKNRLQSSYYCKQPFQLSSDLNFRSKMINEYKIWGDVYPVVFVTDKLKKRGLDGFHGCNPYYLVKQLLQEVTITETLLKTKQYDLLVAYTSTNRERDVNWYWNQIRIATKHKYIVDDPIMWLDYLKLLSDFRKDINNPHYICPYNLKQAHDELMALKNKRDEEIERNRKQQELLRKENERKEFEKRIQKFLSLRFADEDIEIVPLSSLEEFMKEGEMMSHCVFSNRYYARKDCLILSARIGEKHIETVEVDLVEWQVVQSRGKCNQTTPYHDQIINLVNQNINLIKQIA